MRKLFLTTAAVAASIWLAAGCGNGAPNTLIDKRDGQTYKTVKIGRQTWMAQNLNYKPPTGNSWCYYNYELYCDEYGRLYDWKTATTVCPKGWMLPSREDWDYLGQAVGGERKLDGEGMIDWYGAGKKLKSKSDWKDYWGDKVKETDDYGFSALPSGFRDNYGGFLNGDGTRGNWWTATESDSDNAYYRSIYHGYEGLDEYHHKKSIGISVRCVAYYKKTAPAPRPTTTDESRTDSVTPVTDTVPPAGEAWTITCCVESAAPVTDTAPRMGTITDARDGQTYKTVKIGRQTWMAQNLNYKPQTGNSWCYYYYEPYCGKYGRLYDWSAAKTACPAGYHLPSIEEWSELTSTVYHSYDGSAVKMLKSKSGWSNHNNGTDDFGFSALPGGYRYGDGRFYNAGDDGYWRMATESGYYMKMVYRFGGLYEGIDYGRSFGYSVRCVADSP
jgi:uncharacterized protein (TIGR02145 family)